MLIMARHTDEGRNKRVRNWGARFLRKVLQSEEGFGLIPRINVAFWNLKSFFPVRGRNIKGINNLKGDEQKQITKSASDLNSRIFHFSIFKVK